MLPLVSGRFSMVRSRRWWNPKVRSKNMKLKSKDQHHTPQLVFFVQNAARLERRIGVTSHMYPWEPYIFQLANVDPGQIVKVKGKEHLLMACSNSADQPSNFSGVRRLDYHGLTVSQKSPLLVVYLSCCTLPNGLCLCSEKSLFEHQSSGSGTLAPGVFVPWSLELGS